MKIIPFEDALLPKAAELLAKQQSRQRATFPELPARFEEWQVAQQTLTGLLQMKYGSGFAALEGGHLIAYLIGARIVDNPVWGRGGWVHSAGCAYDTQAGVEAIRDLYAVLGAQWVAQGIFNHFVLVNLGDPVLIQAWHSLSFGIEQIHGLLDLQKYQPERLQLADGIVIRRAGPGDGPYLAELSDVIWRLQVQAPVWGVMIPEAVHETAAGWAKLADDEQAMVWLAFMDGRAVGVQGYWAADRAEGNNLHIPDRCVHLSVAGTREEARGQGIGSLMTQVGLSEMRSLGFCCCEADWRSTNLLASRFWLRRGFRPVVYRLARRVDQRIAWAGG